jgi:hypothetical protein
VTIRILRGLTGKGAQVRASGVGALALLAMWILRCFVADSAPDLRSELGWDFVHPVSTARVLGTFLQYFLLGFAASDKVAIHPNISTIDRLCHPESSCEIWRPGV